MFKYLVFPLIGTAKARERELNHLVKRGWQLLTVDNGYAYLQRNDEKWFGGNKVIGVEQNLTNLTMNFPPAPEVITNPEGVDLEPLEKGDSEKAVEYPMGAIIPEIVLHDLEHVHVGDRCIKNRFGLRCDLS